MATAKLGFAGRVAVITGAGGGLGREYALEFARRGAEVVVNDLGGSFKGEGQSTKLADKVVNEIISQGGKAVANYDSVEDGEKIINTAIQNFGKVDILVNNAGILRDRSFQNMSESDWDKIFQVHVKGAFKVTKAAWPHMRKQKYGRIIMTTSPAGLYGNFGQSNYSAAKMALHGLCKTLSIEGKKSNIHVNTIAPLALTRMTEDILPGADLKPGHVSPFVVYLCHKTCNETGTLVEAAGGYACKTRFQRSRGAQLRKFIGDYPSVETVAESWEKLTDFSMPTVVESNNDSANVIMESIQDLPEHPLSANASDLEIIKANKLPEFRFMYTSWDVIRYALSIGAGLPNDGAFVYEGHSEFCVIPSFAACMGQNMVFSGFTDNPGLAKLDTSRVVHGEHFIELMKPIPTSGKFVSRGRIIDVIDKRKFVQLIMETEVLDEQKEVIARNQFVVLFLGTGGMGRKGRSDVQIPALPPPNRAPDSCVEEKTDINQAAFYRLNGDPNPLHIDKDFANMTGFDEPIMHGLCTFGFGLRHVLKTFANNDVSLFKSIKAQFSKPVIPGQTLVTEMWCEGKRVYFQIKVKENGDTVIKGAYVDFHKDVKNTMTSTTAPVSSPSTSSNNLKADKFFSDLGTTLTSNPDSVKSMKGSFLFQVTKDEKVAGEYLLDFKSPTPSISNVSGTPKADVTMKVSDDNLIQLGEGKLKPMSAFMQGKIKVSGKIALTQQLESVFKVAKASLSSPQGTTSSSGVESSANSSLKAAKLFNEIKQKLAGNVDAIKNIKGSFLFKITRSHKLAGEWLLNFNQSPPLITVGPGTADVTITIDDNDFEALATGKLNSMQAFMQGKLKATGKIMLAQKLGDLFKSYSSKL